MPSRKKAKGKARKAAKDKEAKAAKEESQAVVEVAANQQNESIEAQLQGLMINSETPKLCKHGCPPRSPEEEICFEFINAFMTAFLSQDDLVGSFTTAYNATIDKYADVYYSMLNTVTSMLLACGTQLIIDDDNHAAALFACLASYFEEWIALCYRETKGVPSLTKAFELSGADDNTLVSYCRKRISCSCLDEKYKEVKSVKKMGLCYNSSCSKPNRRVERCKMFSCTRCGGANYCSDACQKTHWKEHKPICDEDVKLKTAFDSKQS